MSPALALRRSARSAFPDSFPAPHELVIHGDWVVSRRIGSELTPWKSACLKHCRDPLTLVAGHLHRGRFGALGLGIHHGVFCAGCCWALMMIQLVLGVMNLTVMVAVAFVIALEKLLPKGEWLARVTGVAAIAAGMVIALLSVRV